MEIGKKAMVALTYDLRVDGEEGQIIEQVTAEKPLLFLYGAGQMLPAFELHLAGRKAGELFEIMLDYNNAYGAVNEEAVVDLPKNIFMVDGAFNTDLVKPGNNVPMMTGSGQRLNGRVLEVTEKEVRMDFNHPLAGEDLYFRGEILEVRPATDEELISYLSGGCDCSSGECSSGSHGGGCSGCGC